MAKVFVSYSRRNEGGVTGLVSDFEALGHVVWLDQELSGGQRWWDQILASVRDCDVFVFVVDPHSMASTACQREFSYAIDLAKPILPVIASDGVSVNLLPPELARLQFVDYTKRDREAGFKLARAVGGLPTGQPLPNPLPLPPEVPMSYLGGLGRKVDSASNLSYDDQSVLLGDLRRSVRDPETAADARVLLTRLRKRRDLFASIAEDIDELVKPLPLVSEPRRESEPIPKPAIPPLPRPDVRPSTESNDVYRRWQVALACAPLGFMLGVIALTAMLFRTERLHPTPVASGGPADLTVVAVHQRGTADRAIHRKAWATLRCLRCGVHRRHSTRATIVHSDSAERDCAQNCFWVRSPTCPAKTDNSTETRPVSPAKTSRDGPRWCVVDAGINSVSLSTRMGHFSQTALIVQTLSTFILTVLVRS